MKATAALRLIATVSTILTIPQALAANHVTVVPGGGQYAWGLGRGYDAALGRFNEQCVTGLRRSLGAKRARVRHDYAATLDDLLENAYIDGTGGLDVGLARASKEVEYLAKIARSDRRESLIIEFHVDTVSLGLEQATLTSKGLAAANENSVEKRRRCGDQYVSQMDFGYRVVVALTLHFRKHEDYENYKQNHEVSFLFGAIEDEDMEIAELQEYGEDLWFSINVHQDGGDPATLEELASVGHCPAWAPGACLARFLDILGYLSAPVGAGGFRDSMGHAEPMSPKGPAILRYYAVDYSMGGIEGFTGSAPAATIVASVAAARQALRDSIVRNHGARERLAFELLREGLCEMESAQYKRKINNAEANINALNGALNDCEMRYSAEGCIEMAQQVQRDLLDITLSDAIRCSQ